MFNVLVVHSLFPLKECPFSLRYSAVYIRGDRKKKHATTQIKFILILSETMCYFGINVAMVLLVFSM